MRGIPGQLRSWGGSVLAGAAAAIVVAGTAIGASARVTVVDVSYADAAPLIELLAEKAPAALVKGAGAPLRAWTEWVTAQRRSTVERLERGDEDSVVNLWLFGTSFTRLPPAREGVSGADEAGRGASLLDGRLDDLLARMRDKDADERVVFARAFLERRGIDPTTRPGRDAARRLLRAARDRARAEFAATDAVLTAARRAGDPSRELQAHSTVFQERGLSSDTSLLVDYAIDRTLATARDGGLIAPGAVRRVAVIGPGLDFINKADGHDFYPQQTIQPFLVIDSLLRLGLAVESDLEVLAIDVNPRVTWHLASARQRAARGEPYLMHLPLPGGERWQPGLREYWRGAGGRIGTEGRARPAPETDPADVRAVAVRPAMVGRVVPMELDIVTQRVAMADDEQVDLAIATNVLVYYAPFEQGLAAANIAAMLAPGGVLLSNNDVFVMEPMKTTVGHLAIPYSDRQNDHMFVYQRR